MKEIILLKQAIKMVNRILRNKVVRRIYDEARKRTYRAELQGQCTLKKAVQTRWNSSLTCIASVLRAKYGLQNFFLRLDELAAGRKTGFFSDQVKRFEFLAS